MYKRILVPVDLSEKGFSDRAVQKAIHIAERDKAELHLLTVIPGFNMPMVAAYFPQDAMDKVLEDSRALLRAFAQEQLGDSKLEVQTHIAEGNPYKRILEWSERLQADLIIMPSHKRSALQKAMLGSVASKVVEQAKVSVLVLR
ncbi:universal stress protein [Balneatrix alpica]|uniref:Universal stress protein n=1 Tax=Balneatrix alpica TaxID=75684 RepID=A0ABV5ZJ46_9GAMM|nr:universal stress protein [Balneatrix alpica]